jgi:uncharacterized iron-regulated protein
MAPMRGLKRLSKGGLLIMLWALAAAGGWANAAEQQADGESCVPVAKWVIPAEHGTFTMRDVLQRLADKRIILLGEHHDNPEHHRWQLQTLAALYAEHPNMVIGFEMFPRRVQPALDRWVRGELSEKEFLKQTDWNTVWSYDPQMYMPIFNFARMNRIPMYAINMDHALITRIRDKGLNAVSEKERDGVTEPAPPSNDYLDMLDEIYHEHGVTDEKKESPEQLYKDDKSFQSFVRGQLLWDRVMAEGLARLAKQKDPPLVVGMMGSGHLIDHFGIPHQLDALGIHDSAVLVPWDKRYDCDTLEPRFADVVFGVRAPVDTGEHETKPRLGVFLAAVDKGPKITKVIADSVAAATGLQSGDVVVELAGRPAKDVMDMVKTVQAMVPGTWLPMGVMRDHKRIDLVAKFPPETPSPPTP